MPDSNVCLFYRPQFGTVFDLSTSEFVDSIDNEQPTVFVIVHIYEKASSCTDVYNVFL